MASANAQLVGAAFDGEAPTYDATFGRNPVGLLFRHAFQERLQRLFAPGQRVVDLGCGTGEDAVFLAGRGVHVVGLDPSAEMIARSRAKAAARAVPSERLRFEVRPAEELGTVAGEGSLDGAYSDFGALNCADLTLVGRELSRALRPGAPVLLSLMGRTPLPRRLHAAWREGRLSPDGRPPRVGGVAVPVSYPSLRRARSELGPELAWRDAFGLGVLIPGPDHAAWVERHPHAFGLLAGLETLLRRLPVLRELGDHVVLEGVRR